MLLVKTLLKYSLIHGVGCFADEDIIKGTLVWRFDEGIDLALTASEIAQLPDSFQAFLKTYAYVPLNSDDDMYILCIDHARHMNHSDNPNLLETPGGENVAARDIKRGEELTCNYQVFDREFKNKLRIT